MSPHPSTTPGSRLAPRPVRLGAAAVALGLFAAAMWFVWLGWDHDYYVVDGMAQGPYRAWQVWGCGLCVATAAVVAQLWVRTQSAILVLAAAGVIGFAVPWTHDAASTDETGLWGVGLLMLLSGGGSGLTVLLALAHAAAPTRRRRGQDA